MSKMYITNSKIKIKALKRGDNNFTINDGLTLTPRAGFQINQECPREYKLILAECINNGWIIPVAFMTETEYMWEELKK